MPRAHPALLAVALTVALAACACAEDAAQSQGPPLRDLPDAPEVGDRLPDFTVTDQNGKPVSFHEARGGKKAYLLIVRSASW